jgi:hypothetical protein
MSATVTQLGDDSVVLDWGIPIGVSGANAIPDLAADLGIEVLDCVATQPKVLVRGGQDLDMLASLDLPHQVLQ